MKKDFGIGLASFVVTLGVISGLWAVLKIDASAKGIGFSGLERSSYISLSAKSQLDPTAAQVLTFILDFPQMLPVSVRLAAWGLSYSSVELQKYSTGANAVYGQSPVIGD